MKTRTPKNDVSSHVDFFREDYVEDGPIIDPYEGLSDEELKAIWEDWEADNIIEQNKADA